VAASALGPPPWQFGPQEVASARSTVKSGAAPCALAASISRRALTEKFGRVKRPSQELFGSRATLTHEPATLQPTF
jgi:hypothetical protein